MNRLAWPALACVFVLSGGRASAEDEEDLANRVVALEVEAKRLLSEVEALRSRMPQNEAWFRAELAARYRAEVGEAIPEDALARESEALARQSRQLLDAAVRRTVEAGRKSPIATPLAGPLVILQVRSGAGGGNPNRVDMLGRLSTYVVERSRTEIPWNPVVDSHEPSRAYALGGAVPKGKVFAVTKVTWRAVAAGDSNGHGEYVIRLGEETISRDRDRAATYSGSWTGRTEIRPGEESQVQVEVANSSAVEARFEGELVDESR